MARTPKPVALQTGHITDEEKAKREEQEARLKGKNHRVYRPPKELIPPVQKIYKAIAGELKQANILNNLDVELLSTTAYAIYRMQMCRQALDEFGLVTTDANGKLIKSPYVQIEKDYQAIYHTGCLQLGLSPSSRAKLALMAAESEVDTDDGF